MLVRATSVAVAVALCASAGWATWTVLDRVLDVAVVPTFDEVAAVPHPDAPPGAPTTLVLPQASGVSTYLVFGVGSAGLDESDSSKVGIGSDRLEMSDGLTDSIALVVLDASNEVVEVVSIPRDTWLAERRSRINEVYSTSGPQEFADVVTELTGVPVNHMVAVNFAGVVDVVDALGGVEVTVPAAMKDSNSGLDVAAGCVRLDGRQALALSRSRHVRFDDGSGWRTDPTGDFGRIERTQQLFAAMLSEVPPQSLVSKMPALLSAASDNVIRDSALDLPALVSLSRAFSSSMKVSFWQPPADPKRVGAASVVSWRNSDAAPVLERLAAAVAAGALTGGELTDPLPEAPSAGAASPSTVPPQTSSSAEVVERRRTSVLPDVPQAEVAVPTGVSPVPPITAGCAP